MGEVVLHAVEDEAGTIESLEIWNAVYTTMRASLADVRDYQRFCAAHLDLVAYLDGQSAGSGFVAVERQQAEGEIAKALIAVLPEHRRRGVGTALYDRASRWAAAQSKSVLETWVIDLERDGLDYATRRGFHEFSRESFAALDLTATETPRFAPPDRVSIVSWADRPGLGRGMYDVALEALPDIPGNDKPVPSYADWLEFDMGGSGDRPETTFIALADDEVVGYAKLHLSDARPGVATHDITGVKRAWRGRGVARALKTAQISWAKKAGYQQLETANELRNEPIRRLNQRLGYRPIPGRALLRGRLSPGAGP
jgi:GNAT superfamily N-acetyltransferase